MSEIEITTDDIQYITWYNKLGESIKSKCNNCNQDISFLHYKISPINDEFICSKCFIMMTDIKAIFTNRYYNYMENKLDIIKDTSSIFCPYGHYDKMINEKNLLMDQFNIFINNLNINDKIIVFDKDYNYALICKITGDIELIEYDDIKIVSNNNTCHSETNLSCFECRNNIISICSEKYVDEKRLSDFKNDDQFIVKNLNIIKRNIEIIDKINEDNQIYKLYKNPSIYKNGINIKLN